MPLINLLSYAGLPDGDPDDLSISALLAERGIEIAVRDWRTLELNQSDNYSNDDTLYLLRSTWDYDSHYDQFMAFVDRVPGLINTASTVKWNADKSYLQHFDKAAPSLFVGRHLDDYNHFGLSVLEKGLKDIIVKPCVGLSTHGVKRFVDCNSEQSLYRAWEHARRLAESAPVMVQRFIESVETYRERSLIFIDGEFTHSVSKTAFQSMAPAGEAGEKAEVASEAEIDFAQGVMDRFMELGVGPCPVYARVDIVRDDDNGYFLLELELIEPSLFLSYSAKARQKLVDALSRKLIELSTHTIKD